MNRFLRATDREEWGKRRARGFFKFFLEETWPYALGWITVDAFRRVTKSGHGFGWGEEAVTLAGVLLMIILGAVIKWWNRERAYQKTASDDSARVA